MATTMAITGSATAQATPEFSNSKNSASSFLLAGQGRRRQLNQTGAVRTTHCRLSSSTRRALEGGDIARWGGRPSPRPLPPAASRGGALVVSANLFGRFTRVLRGTVTYYGDEAVSMGENPVKLLDTIVDDMQTDLIRMRQASSQVLAAQRMLESKYQDAVRSAEDWQRRAELAVRADSDELAREALRRRKTFSDLAASQKLQLDQHTRATESLMGSIRVMEGKLQEAKGKKQTLKARAMSAEASKMVNEQLSDILGGLRNSSNSSMAAFAAMEEKVVALEAEAEGAAMFAPIGDALESRFALLEGGLLGVDDELEQMKRTIKAPIMRAQLSEKMNDYGYININVR